LIWALIYPLVCPRDAGDILLYHLREGVSGASIRHQDANGIILTGDISLDGGQLGCKFHYWAPK